MIKEIFIGKPLSHFHVNPIIKAFILSETFLWAAWNSVTPIFAIFAATQIPGGNAEIAASVFSAYMVSRVIFELISARLLNKASDFKKFLFSIFGIFFISGAYIGFAYSKSVLPLYLYAAVSGFGMGIATPAKNALFSTHLDKQKESMEWGVYDAAVFMAMALAAIAGGFIATKYGFQLLFLLAAGVNILAIIPYLLYIHYEKK